MAAGTRDGNFWIWDLESGYVFKLSPEKLTIRSVDAAFHHSVELEAWRASDGMTTNLEPYDRWLLQTSGGLLKICSTDTYQLLYTVKLYQWSCDALSMFDETVLSYGRDANTAGKNHICGLEGSAKGWKLAWGEGNEGNQTTEMESFSKDVSERQQSGQGSFGIGLPTTQARGLVVLKDKVVISIMRRGTWVVEIWANSSYM